MDSAPPRFAQALHEILQQLRSIPSPTAKDVNRLKFQAAEKYQLREMPTNSQLILALGVREREKLLPVLRRKMTRIISGVSVIAVMTKPHPCPQAEPCAYCPGGPRYGVPQSYTGHEPAAMRGMQNHYDPYRQVKSRLQQLSAIGHEVDKVELIVMGGTFPSTSFKYQTWFIRRCLDGLTGKTSRSMFAAKKQAETSKIRNVGITVETRPDWAKQSHVDGMLRLGVTRVELGVQNPSDRIYRMVGRTHTVNDVIDATRILKDSGLKIVYHLMPGLPGSDPASDLRAFKRVFTNPAFKPDMLKIYPCLVMKGTKAYEWHQNGDFQPYTTEQAIDVVAGIKKMIPPWIRVMRVQRDIPSPLIVAGVKRSNLRQEIQLKLSSSGEKCSCIRCREIGLRSLTCENELDLEKVTVFQQRYKASEGEEIFISAELPEKDALIGYLRLRIPSEKAHRKEIRAQPCTIVRELHIYGPLVPVGKRMKTAWQHKGYGELLMKEAEHISRDDYSFKKMLVISALGTKRYYKRMGYDYDGVYMSKDLRDLS